MCSHQFTRVFRDPPHHGEPRLRPRSDLQFRITMRTFADPFPQRRCNTYFWRTPIDKSGKCHPETDYFQTEASDFYLGLSTCWPLVANRIATRKLFAERHQSAPDPFNQNSADSPKTDRNFGDAGESPLVRQARRRAKTALCASGGGPRGGNRGRIAFLPQNGQIARPFSTKG